MSSRELERVEVMGRVESGDLKLSDAAVMLELSYRQAKRLWRRYGQVGSEGLKHGNAGQPLRSTTIPCGVGCWRKGCGAGNGSASDTANEGSANRILGNWCSWTGVSIIGSKGVVRGVA